MQNKKKIDIIRDKQKKKIKNVETKKKQNIARL